MSKAALMADFCESKSLGKCRRESTCSAVVDGRKMTVVFSDDVLELIFSRMSFPSLFKVPLLSRNWFLKFPFPSPFIHSQLPKLSKRWSLEFPLACQPPSSFQRLICSTAGQWPIYCPVQFTQNEILGFDRASSKWQRMMTLDQLSLECWGFVTSAGCLICVAFDSSHFYEPHENHFANFDKVLVTNALTKCCRNLDLPDHLMQVDEYGTELIFVKILAEGSDAYKVILVYRCIDVLSQRVVETHIYDSGCRTWKGTLSSEDLRGTVFRDTAYLDGTLYCISRCNEWDPLTFFIYDLEEDNKWTEIFEWAPEEEDQHVLNAGVLLCGETVMVALCFHTKQDDEPEEDQPNLFGKYSRLHPVVPRNSFGVYKLDMECFLLEEVSIGPPDAIIGINKGERDLSFACDSSFVYFGQMTPGSPVVTYNLKTKSWDCLPPASFVRMPTHGMWPWWDGSAFQPGLNPFVVV